MNSGCMIIWRGEALKNPVALTAMLWGVYFLTAFMPENSNLYRLNEVAPRALIWVRAVHTRTLQALHTRNNYFN